jgi:hypothetical protein
MGRQTSVGVHAKHLIRARTPGVVFYGTVPAGAKVPMQLVNADTTSAHGLVVPAADASHSRTPMMTSGPAFSGAAVWFLGNSTSAGVHTATITFTDATAGTYQYLCPLPGYAQRGMADTLVVAS